MRSHFVNACSLLCSGNLDLPSSPRDDERDQHAENHREKIHAAIDLEPCAESRVMYVHHLDGGRRRCTRFVLPRERSCEK
jgi:hypothetical protein